MIAFGFLILLVGIWMLINTLNGNLPGLVNIPGLHDATTGIRGLTDPSTLSNSTGTGTITRIEKVPQYPYGPDTVAQAVDRVARGIIAR